MAYLPLLFPLACVGHVYKIFDMNCWEGTLKVTWDSSHERILCTRNWKHYIQYI